MQPINDNPTAPTPAAPAAPSSPPPAPPDCAAPAAPDAVPPASPPPDHAVPAAALAPRRSHRASGEARILREKLDGNEILISLALLGEATKMQLLAFHFPGSPIRRIERHLKPLLDQGLIARRTRYTFDTRQGVPVPSAHAYRLSPEGHALVANDPRYPVQTGTDEYRARLPNPDTTQVQEHDLLGSEAISWLVVLARGGGLSGMFLRREQQLDPQARAPRIDAVLVVHFGGPPLADGAFVWTKNPPADAEQSLPLALEIDRNTEAISVIRGKAVRYQEAHGRQRTHDYWEAHYGRLPIILWVAPTARRLEAIHRVWMETWPEGHWALATIDELSCGRCLIYDGARGELAQLRPFDGPLPYMGYTRRSWPAEAGFEPPPTLPPPPPALPPPPAEEPALPPLSAPLKPRIIQFCYSEADAGPPPVDEPQVGHLLIVHVTDDADLRWEGYLYPDALRPIELGPQFADLPLMISCPGQKYRATFGPDENPIQLEVSRPHASRLPEPWEYGDPPLRLWDRLHSFWAALRNREEWAIHLLWFVPLALAMLSPAVVAITISVIGELQAWWDWAELSLARAGRWFALATRPIGGPDNAIGMFLSSLALGMAAWAYRARIAQFARESWPFVCDYWQLILFSIFYVLLVVGGMLLVWSLQ